MRPIRLPVSRGLLALAIGAAISGGAQAQQPSARYGVVDIRFAPKADDALGTRRSGVFCVPSGTVRWRDAKPDRDEAVTAVSDVLAARGMSPPTSGAAQAGGRYDIHGELRHVSLNPCVPPTGIGSIMNRSRTVKGNGEIEMLWRIESADGSSPSVSFARCTDFQFKDTGVSLAAMTLKGIRDAAQQLADELKAGAVTQPATGRSTEPACR